MHTRALHLSGAISTKTMAVRAIQDPSGGRPTFLNTPAGVIKIPGTNHKRSDSLLYFK